jgi:hypothetical protein
MAELIAFGDPPPTVGGAFERSCASLLRDKLPDGCIVATNLALHRGGSQYYELDAVVATSDFCDVLEFKCIGQAGGIDVHEDAVIAPGFTDSDRILPLLDSKAKRLKSRLHRSPFQMAKVPHVGSFVVVPDGVVIRLLARFGEPPPVLQISDLLRFYETRFTVTQARQASQEARVRHRTSWLQFKRGPDSSKTEHRLGRFVIKRRVSTKPGRSEYLAVDEPPSAVEVHLAEIAFDPTLSVADLSRTLHAVSREMQILRRIRHPNVIGVVGHFQTGSSWVQVSDWFDGKPLDDRWRLFTELPLLDRIGVFLAAARGLQHCHNLGVFHRNFSAGAILVSDDWQDVRVSAFEYARDIELDSTISTGRMLAREPRLIPPEELLGGKSTNPRLGDVFQAGVLLYRIVRGSWLFDNSHQYSISQPDCDNLVQDSDPLAAGALRIAMKMLDREPGRRQNSMGEVVAGLQSIVSAQ